MKPNVELEASHHDDFASDAFTKFIELWKNGKEAALNINCRNGKAWIQISCFLGYQNDAKSFTPGNSKLTKPSPSKLRRNKERAENFRLKKRQEASRLEQSKLSKSNTSNASHFEVEIPNTSLESQQIDLKDLDETTVVRHSKPSLETFQNNEKGSVVDAND